MIKEQEKSLTGKRIGIFGKGGSGKSTVAVLLAKALNNAGYSVAVLDADSTNVGLPQALGAMPPAPLLDYYGGMVFSGGLVTCPVDDPTPLAGADLDLDDLPPAYQGHSANGIDLFVAGKIGDKGPGAGCDGPIAKIARDFRPRYTGEAPVTLVDFKAGFEDSARGNIVSLDRIIVVIDPTTVAPIFTASAVVSASGTAYKETRARSMLRTPFDSNVLKPFIAMMSTESDRLFVVIFCS